MYPHSDHKPHHEYSFGKYSPQPQLRNRKRFPPGYNFGILLPKKYIPLLFKKASKKCLTMILNCMNITCAFSTLQFYIASRAVSTFFTLIPLFAITPASEMTVWIQRSNIITFTWCTIGKVKIAMTTNMAELSSDVFLTVALALFITGHIGWSLTVTITFLVTMVAIIPILTVALTIFWVAAFGTSGRTSTF